MKENLLVSVCIPTFNRFKYLKKTLDSIVKQTYKNLEIIVLDNASTDNTEELVQEYIIKYGIKYFRNPVNIGAENWNKCVDLASGEYIALYHSDDIYDSQIVEKETKVLSNNKDIGAVFTSGYHINKNDRIVNRSKLSFIKENEIYYLDNRNGFQKFLDFGCFLICPTSMIRKEIYKEIGNFNCSKYKQAFDFDLWIRILLKYKIAIINEPLVKYRIHPKFAYEFDDEPDGYKVIDNYINNKEYFDIFKNLNLVKFNERRKADRFKFAVRLFCENPDKSLNIIKTLNKYGIKYKIIYILFKALKTKILYLFSKLLISTSLKLDRLIKY